MTHDFKGVLSQKKVLPVEAPSLKRLMEVLEQREGEKWAVMDVRITTGIDEIVHDIVDGIAVGVSDGSFKFGDDSLNGGDEAK